MVYYVIYGNFASVFGINLNVDFPHILDVHHGSFFLNPLGLPRMPDIPSMKQGVDYRTWTQQLSCLHPLLVTVVLSKHGPAIDPSHSEVDTDLDIVLI